MKTDKDETHGFAVWLTEMCSLGTVKLKEAKGNNWEQTKKKGLEQESLSVTEFMDAARHLHGDHNIELKIKSSV